MTYANDRDGTVVLPALQGWSSRRSCIHRPGLWLGHSAPREMMSAGVKEGKVVTFQK